MQKLAISASAFMLGNGLIYKPNTMQHYGDRPLKVGQ